MTPARRTLRQWRNSIFPLDEWRLVVDGQPIDISAWTLELQVRLYDGAGGSALISVSSASMSGNRIEKTAPTDGAFLIHVSEASWDALPAATRQNKPQRFRYDLRGGPSGALQVYAYGDFLLHTGVSQ